MGVDLPVSVLILTLNEAQNIERCMRSVGWSDDIVVLDSFSSDDTVEMATRLGARVFSRAFDDFASQRNHALDTIDFRHEWILHLDADEIVTEELQREMAGAIASPRYHAYRIPSKLMFQGKWLRFSGMYPVYQVRLGLKNSLRFLQSGHGQRETVDSNRVGTLAQPYIHYGFSKGLADWIERHNRYSSAEAAQNTVLSGNAWREFSRLVSSDRTDRRRAAKGLAGRMPFRPFLRFCYMYLLKLGFLDGRAGWIYCRLVAGYEFWTVLKERELRRAKG